MSLLDRFQLQNLEMEPAGRKVRGASGADVRPRMIGRIGYGRIQIEEELVGKAIDGRRLPERQPHADRLLQSHAFRLDRLLGGLLINQ